MTISNPFNVKLVTQQGSEGKDVGEKIYVMAKRNHAVAAVNASGFGMKPGMVVVKPESVLLLKTVKL